MQVRHAGGHERVRTAGRPCQLRQSAVQRHSVLHVGCLPPLHHRPHALRPAVQAVGVGQQLGGGAGGTRTGGAGHRHLIVAAGRHKQLREGTRDVKRRSRLAARLECTQASNCSSEWFNPWEPSSRSPSARFNIG